MRDTQPSVHIKKIYSQSWQVFLQHWKFILVVGLVTTMITVGLNSLTETLFSGPWTGGVVSLGINIVVSNLIALGWIKNFLRMSRGAKPSIDLFTESANKIPKYFLGTLALGALVVLGLIFLILPGIYLAIRYQFVPTLITDKNLGLLAAFRKSSQMSQGNMKDLTLLLLCNAALLFLGFMTLGIGLVVAVPLSTIAGTIVYLELIKNT